MAKYTDFNNKLTAAEPLVHDIDAIEQSVNRLLKVREGDLLDEPTFDSGVAAYVYENMNEDTEAFFQMDIARSFKVWEKRVKLTRINIRDNLDKHELRVELGIFSKEFDKNVLIKADL